MRGSQIVAVESYGSVFREEGGPRRVSSQLHHGSREFSTSETAKTVDFSQPQIVRNSKALGKAMDDLGFKVFG